LVLFSGMINVVFADKTEPPGWHNHYRQELKFRKIKPTRHHDRVPFFQIFILDWQKFLFMLAELLLSADTIKLYYVTERTIPCQSYTPSIVFLQHS
jgi:hypothetical protein